MRVVIAHNPVGAAFLALRPGLIALLGMMDQHFVSAEVREVVVTHLDASELAVPTAASQLSWILRFRTVSPEGKLCGCLFIFPCRMGPQPNSVKWPKNNEVK